MTKVAADFGSKGTGVDKTVRLEGLQVGEHAD